MTDAEANDSPLDFDLLDLPAVDEDAIRRAVRRGVVRVAFTAAAWLLLAVVVAAIGAAVVTAAQTRHFAAVVEDGIRAAHPELDLHGMSCCGGLTSLEVDGRGEVVGDLSGSRQAVVQVKRSFFGHVDVNAGDRAATPVGRALAREPASKAATRALVAKLPDTVVASAVVEFETPLPPDEIPSVTPVKASALLLNSPFTAESLVGWPGEGDISSFVRWADGLRPGDDLLLADLDLPSSATLRQIAGNPQVYAVVVGSATPAQLRSLLENPRVRDLNLADIAFDPTAQ